jgi:hypothetical protein
MELETRNVFIDTQSFVGHGLNFQHSALKAFQTLCEKDRLFHITTSVVKREVESQITESIYEALSALKTFRRKARVLASANNETIQALFTEIDDAHILKESLEVFEKFLRSTKANVLTLSDTDPETVFDRYFGRQPPFGDGKKKTEFPDAFSLSALEQFAETEKEKVYVVSDDADLVNACTGHKYLIHINTLDKLLDTYNTHESALSNLLKKFIDENQETLKDKIKEKMDDTGAFNEGSWEDSEVEDFSARVVELYEPAVVNVDENSAVVTFDFDADIVATVIGPDWNGGYYDREEGRMHTFNSKTKYHAGTDTFTAEVELMFEYSNGKLNDCEIEGVSIGGTIWGIPINVEEND